MGWHHGYPQEQGGYLMHDNIVTTGPKPDSNGLVFSEQLSSWGEKYEMVVQTPSGKLHGVRVATEKRGKKPSEKMLAAMKEELVNWAKDEGEI